MSDVRAIPLGPEDKAILDLECSWIAGHTCKLVALGPGAPSLHDLRDLIGERITAVPELTQKAEGYGMPHAKVDGMNMIAVHDKAREMIEAIRTGAGPMFLEATTYRYRGHSMGDPERYRKAEEVHKWQESDPIGIYRHYLADHEIATEQELDEQEKEAERIVEEAVQFAESSPEPAPEALYENIYVSEEC